jgi:hypothetical protein
MFPGPWETSRDAPGTTRGPWHWTKGTGTTRGSEVIYVVGADQYEVAVIRDPIRPADEPNARLIVGSHDLLAGCRLALALMRDYAPMMWADQIAWIEQAVTRAAADLPTLGGEHVSE